MIQVREYARLTTDERATPSLDCAVVKRETLEWVLKLASEWKGEDHCYCLMAITYLN